MAKTSLSSGFFIFDFDPDFDLDCINVFPESASREFTRNGTARRGEKSFALLAGT